MAEKTYKYAVYGWDEKKKTTKFFMEIKADCLLKAIEMADAFEDESGYEWAIMVLDD